MCVIVYVTHCGHALSMYIQPAPKEPAPSSRPTTPARPGTTGYKNIAELSASFVRFLQHSPNQEIPLKYVDIITMWRVYSYLFIQYYTLLVLFRTFQQKFQTFYHRSGFRVSDYLPGNATTRDLIDACEGVKVTTTWYTDCLYVVSKILGCMFFQAVKVSS